ncbi:MAG: RNA methyltransferase [Bacteroides sp.]|nr:RNA methyltransferase [Bacteroides sp.]MCM1447953.1 RNA methyltransferase [Bacteroides sp.]
MQISETITSTQNQRIKALVQLQQKSSCRRSQRLFVVEGRRELAHCISRGYVVDTLFLCPDILRAEGEYESLMVSMPRCRAVQVSANVYERIAYRGGTEGVVATMHMKDHGLDTLPVPVSGHAPLYVVLESVEKPGNLGAILRSADAAGVDALIVCDPLTDLYNPNLIRASLGGLFSVPTVACTSEECIRYLHDHGVRVLTAQLQDSSLYYDTDMTLPTAIVMGTESTGLTRQWREAADAHIRIPMLGILDSLNVSVSAAILMFEAVRQRQGNGVG